MNATRVSGLSLKTVFEQVKHRFMNIRFELSLSQYTVLTIVMTSSFGHFSGVATVSVS